MSARKHPNRMPTATREWLPAFLSRYELFIAYATADGGLKRIADIMEKVVPFGSDLYCRRLGSPDHAHQRSTGNVCPDFQECLYT